MITHRMDNKLPVFCVVFVKMYFILLGLSLLILPTFGQTLTCEQQNTCMRCDTHKYSYYECNANSDCWENEQCVPSPNSIGGSKRFCCASGGPIQSSGLPFLPQPTGGVGGQFGGGLAITRPPLTFGVGQGGQQSFNGRTNENACPNGSPFSLQTCRADNECVRGREYCSTRAGRCCPRCDALAVGNFDSKTPVCETFNPRFWAARQCDGANCWCVTSDGAEIPSSRGVTSMDCNIRRRIYEEANPVECTTQRPGECPPTSFLSTPATHQCRCDDDCLSDSRMKCCLQVDGRSCTFVDGQGSFSLPTADVKPGQCPNERLQFPGRSCFRDNDCPGAEKCCQNECRVVSNNNLPFNPNQQCTSPNEESVSCGQPCQPSCDDRNRLPCPTLTCTPSCQCRRGYIRQSSTSPFSPCIPDWQCPTTSPMSGQCQGGRVFNSCGTACPKTCDNLNQNTPCTQQCVAECQCPAGTVQRDASPTSPCIPQWQCPTTPSSSRQCQGGRVYTECGSACPPTCEKFADNRACTLQCVPGCQCPPGTVQSNNSPSSVCIPPFQCSAVQPPPNQQCQGGRVFVTCGSACPPSCDNLGQNFPCTQQCVQGCQCPLGTVQQSSSSTSPCIPASQCGTNTTNTEGGMCSDRLKAWSSCHTACPPSCQNPNANQQTCTKQCIRGCSCRPPYVLLDETNINGDCVLPEQCSRFSNNTGSIEQRCKDPQSTYQECGTACPRTCSVSRPSCPTTGCVAGCFCRFGYVLDDKTKLCIPESQCEEQVDGQCSDPLKEWRQCGTACPLGCDKLSGNTFCAPCQSGCYCRSGFVFRSSTDWRRSECVRPTECDQSFSNNPNSNVGPVNQLPSECPALISGSGGGAACRSQNECRTEERCCATSLGNRQCVCGDTNADYQECGCEATCSEPTCSTFGENCQPGCFCRPGFVRQWTSRDAPCVPASSCGLSLRPPTGSLNNGAISVTERGIVQLGGVRPNVVGTLFMEHTIDGAMVLRGSVRGLTPGTYTMSMHVNGDVSEQCTRLGQISDPSLGEVYISSSAVTPISVNVNRVSQPMAGRSVAIRERGGQPLACGVVGLTDRTFTLLKTAAAKSVKKNKT